MTRNNEIIYKYIKGECSQDELREAISYFSKYKHHPEIKYILQNIWNEELKDTSEPDLSESKEIILNQIHHRISPGKRKGKLIEKKYLFTVLKFAAVLVIGLFFGILINKSQKSETVYYTSIAPEGSISQMVLPDSTFVSLNSGSEIKYVINNKNNLREVYLTGEAWFDVTKNKKKPFLVRTSFYDVIVTGTKFNLKVYPDDNEIATTLEEGSVTVTSSDNFKMAGPEVLKPGEQLVYNRKNNLIQTKKVNIRMYTSWKDNKLIFINMNLKELIVLLERKYGVDIEVGSNIILDYHYDGIIHNETILEVLDILKETLPVIYKIEGQKIIIQKQ